MQGEEESPFLIQASVQLQTVFENVEFSKQNKAVVCVDTGMARSNSLIQSLQFHMPYLRPGAQDILAVQTKCSSVFFAH